MAEDDKPPEKKTEPKKGVKTHSRIVAYFKQRHDPLTSLLLTVPVFLVYHLGILLIDLRNGVDLVSELTFELMRRSQPAYVAVTLGYAGAIALAAWALRKRGTIKPAEIAPVILESTTWAFLMLLTVGWAVSALFSPDHAAAQIGKTSLGPLERFVMAAGAGFHEEIVFRVGLYGGTALALEKIGKIEGVMAKLPTALFFSLVFSAVHYVGASGDHFTLVSFVFRALLGLFLTALYEWRGLAVAVYTHAIYDLLVFFVL